MHVCVRAHSVGRWRSEAGQAKHTLYLIIRCEGPPPTLTPRPPPHRYAQVPEIPAQNMLNIDCVTVGR